MTDIDAYKSALEEWRATRLANLKADNGWLNLVGRWEITKGSYSIGSDASNAFVLPTGPAKVAVLDVFENGDSTITPEDGTPMVSVPYAPKASEGFMIGQFLMEITRMNGTQALRVRDTQSPERDKLEAIPHFDVDPKWRIEAEWIKLDAPMNMTVDTIYGVPTKVQVTHKARFALDGEVIELFPTYGSADRPQFVVRDLTSLDDTYARSRFIFGEDVTENSVVIDFNKAINPPCAFTHFAVCPLPPRENLFFQRIEAGERRI